jgi:hypothetical protein
MVSSKIRIRRQSKKLQIQGAQILRNEAYLWYAAVTKDAAQRRSWTSYEAVNVRAFSLDRGFGRRYKQNIDPRYHPALKIE